MPIIELSDRIPGAEWRALSDADPAASFFHDPAWMTALVRSYGYYRPACLTARDSSGALVGGLPGVMSVRFGLKQLLSLPYGTYGGPIAAPGSDEGRRAIRGALIERWAREARRPGVVRAQLVHNGTSAGEDLERMPGRTTRESAFVLDLEGGYDRIWNESFGGEVRTACRKAEKSGVTVAEADGPEGAAILDAMYRRQAAGWSNHTPFPRDLFRHLVAAAPERARVWIAALNGEPAAAHLVLHHRGTALSWISANSLEGRKARAQILLIARILEEACRRGSRTFNFGGAAGSDSLESFKTAFGSRPEPYASCLVEPAWFRPLHRIQYRLRGIDA